MTREIDLPRVHPRRDGRATMHGTAVARRGRGLLLLGPSGAGKSGLAAEMLLLGARLVVDDLMMLEMHDGAVRVSAPVAGEGAATRPLELRGIGPVRVPATGDATVHGAVLLAPSRARLPEREDLALLTGCVPLVRHPAQAGAAAKLLLWLAALPAITAAR